MCTSIYVLFVWSTRQHIVEDAHISHLEQEGGITKDTYRQRDISQETILQHIAGARHPQRWRSRTVIIVIRHRHPCVLGEVAASALFRERSRPGQQPHTLTAAERDDRRGEVTYGQGRRQLTIHARGLRSLYDGAGVGGLVKLTGWDASCSTMPSAAPSQLRLG